MEFMNTVVIALTVWAPYMNKWVDETEEYFKWKIKVIKCTRVKEFDVNIQCHSHLNKNRKMWRGATDHMEQVSGINSMLVSAHLGELPEATP